MFGSNARVQRHTEFPAQHHRERPVQSLLKPEYYTGVEFYVNAPLPASRSHCDISSRTPSIPPPYALRSASSIFFQCDSWTNGSSTLIYRSQRQTDCTFRAKDINATIEVLGPSEQQGRTVPDSTEAVIWSPTSVALNSVTRALAVVVIAGPIGRGVNLNLQRLRSTSIANSGLQRHQGQQSQSTTSQHRFRQSGHKRDFSITCPENKTTASGSTGVASGMASHPKQFNLTMFVLIHMLPQILVPVPIFRLL